jgi:hypothetical protein
MFQEFAMTLTFPDTNQRHDPGRTKAGACRTNGPGVPNSQPNCTL